MTQSDPAAAAPLVDYASAARRVEPMTAYDYLFGLISSATFIGIFVTSFYRIGFMKQIYEDFKLKLPKSTLLLVDLHNLMEDTLAFYWIWVIPFLAPFLIHRFPRRVRERSVLLIILLAGLLNIAVSNAMNAPIVSLVEGIAGPSGKR